MPLATRQSVFVETDNKNYAVLVWAEIRLKKVMEWPIVSEKKM